MWRDTLRGWRAFALVFFIFIAVIEITEVVGDILGFFDLSTYAAFGGITPQMEAQRLTSLVILSSAIAIGACVTVYSILRRPAWTRRAGTITGVVLLFYMGFQILSALTMLTTNNFGVIGAGSTYGMFGLLGIWLVRQF